MLRGTTIAIDGPVASGKTVVGRILARRLRCRFLDTGLTYRAVTWAALQRRVSLEDTAALATLAQELSIEIQESPEGERVLLDGEEVTQDLRSSPVEEAVSWVAQVAGVREALVAKQQALGQSGNIVMVGRDIGTVVLPQAPVKLFLQASIDVRAQRRHQELQASGQESDYTTVRHELEERDRLDTQRIHSPLRPSSEAHLIDTDGVPVEEVVSRILDLVKKEARGESGI